jgi:hypothetical protein
MQGARGLHGGEARRSALRGQCEYRTLAAPQIRSAGDETDDANREYDQNTADDCFINRRRIR